MALFVPALEDLISHFECEVDDGPVSTLRDFWKHNKPLVAPYGEEVQREFLCELILLDMEHCWCNSAAAKGVRDYAAEFSEIGPGDPYFGSMAAEEYRMRQRWGDQPSHEVFLLQFPGLEIELLPELIAIDEELAADFGVPGVSRVLPSLRPRRRSQRRPPIDPAAPLAYSDFTLKRRLGEGATGKVYLALQQSLHREVAIKFLKKVYWRQIAAVQRFLAEARIVARLEHPAIVGTHGLGRTRGGGYFIVMDLIRGEDLGRILARRRASIAESVDWVRQIAVAATYAHQQNVIHCDLKPSNVVLDTAGRVHVTDFGLARNITDHTSICGLAGTPAFMAPEQVATAWGAVGPWTDVYGLGATLFTLLTGQPPYTGTRLADVLAAVTSGRPVRFVNDLRKGIPPSISDICMRCLAKPAQERFASAADVESALGSVQL